MNTIIYRQLRCMYTIIYWQFQGYMYIVQFCISVVFGIYVHCTVLYISSYRDTCTLSVFLYRKLKGYNLQYTVIYRQLQGTCTLLLLVYFGIHLHYISIVIRVQVHYYLSVVIIGNVHTLIDQQFSGYIFTIYWQLKGYMYILQFYISGARVQGNMYSFIYWQVHGYMYSFICRQILLNMYRFKYR